MLDVSQVVEVKLELILLIPVGPTGLLRLKVFEVVGNDSQDKIGELDDVSL